MADTTKNYDSTIMRMAGNIAAGLAPGLADPLYSSTSFAQGVERIAKQSVCLARAIVAEVQRTSDGVAPRKDGQ